MREILQGKKISNFGKRNSRIEKEKRRLSTKKPSTAEGTSKEEWRNKGTRKKEWRNGKTHTAVTDIWIKRIIWSYLLDVSSSSTTYIFRGDLHMLTKMVTSSFRVGCKSPMNRVSLNTKCINGTPFYQDIEVWPVDLTWFGKSDLWYLLLITWNVQFSGCSTFVLFSLCKNRHNPNN